MWWLLFVGLVLSCPFGVPLPLLLYPRGRGYKEGNRVSYNMISIRTLSLLVYFIDIAIYTLRNTPWSSEIFWIVGRVILDPLLGSSESMRDGTPGYQSSALTIWSREIDH
jgi:hypothetical protein